MIQAILGITSTSETASKWSDQEPPQLLTTQLWKFPPFLPIPDYPQIQITKFNGPKECFLPLVNSELV